MALTMGVWEPRSHAPVAAFSCQKTCRNAFLEFETRKRLCEFSNLHRMTKFESPYATRDWTLLARKTLGVLVGIASLGVLFSVEQLLLTAWGLPPIPAVGPADNPVAWDRYMDSLTTGQFVLISVAHLGFTLVSALLASLLAGTRKAWPGIAMGIVGVAVGVANAWSAPGTPVGISMLEWVLHVPVGYAIGSLVMRIKNFLV